MNNGVERVNSGGNPDDSMGQAPKPPPDDLLFKIRTSGKPSTYLVLRHKTEKYCRVCGQLICLANSYSDVVELNGQPVLFQRSYPWPLSFGIECSNGHLSIERYPHDVDLLPWTEQNYPPIGGEPAILFPISEILARVKADGLEVVEETEAPSAIIRGRNYGPVKLMWRLYYLRTAEAEYRQILEVSALHIAPDFREHNQSPSASDVTAVPPATVAEMIGMDVRTRLITGVRNVQSQGRTSGNIWFSDDGKGQMWSTARPAKRNGYVVELLPDVSVEEMVDRALSERWSQ